MKCLFYFEKEIFLFRTFLVPVVVVVVASVFVGVIKNINNYHQAIG